MNQSSHVARRPSLLRLWATNWRLGWSERARGLHYWLGWEYRALLGEMEIRAGATVVDVGTGGHSVWPYLLVRERDARVVATDIDAAVGAQTRRRERAERARVVPSGAVSVARCDARRLPFRDASVDVVTAVSSIEHVRGAHGDRDAMREIARVLRPGGRVWLTVPFRKTGSMIELDESLEHFQWHYSPATLTDSLLRGTGLVECVRVLYGERLPFCAIARRLPAPLQWLLRPWSSLLSRLLLRPTADPTRASAVLLELERPGSADEAAVIESHARATARSH